MAEPVQSFRDFEHAGWADQAVCANYDAQLSRITRQSVQALLDAAGVRQGTRVLDVATGAGYVAGAAAERGAEVCGIDDSMSERRKKNASGGSSRSSIGMPIRLRKD